MPRSNSNSEREKNSNKRTTPSNTRKCRPHSSHSSTVSQPTTFRNLVLLTLHGRRSSSASPCQNCRSNQFLWTVNWKIPLVGQETTPNVVVSKTHCRSERDTDDLLLYGNVLFRLYACAFGSRAVASTTIPCHEKTFFFLSLSPGWRRTITWSGAHTQSVIIHFISILDRISDEYTMSCRCLNVDISILWWCFDKSLSFHFGAAVFFLYFFLSLRYVEWRGCVEVNCLFKRYWTIWGFIFMFNVLTDWHLTAAAKCVPDIRFSSLQTPMGAIEM